jgi:hypothetical protein
MKTLIESLENTFKTGFDDFLKNRVIGERFFKSSRRILKLSLYITHTVVAGEIIGW